MQATGTTGKLMAGGQLVASLTAWTHVGDTDNWQTTATARDVNEFWLSGASSLDVWLRVGPKWWIWRGVAVRCEGTAITITGAGRPEMR